MYEPKCFLNLYRPNKYNTAINQVCSFFLNNYILVTINDFRFVVISIETCTLRLVLLKRQF